MTRNGRVSLPDVTTDRPQPLVAAAVATVALMTGLASAFGLRDGCANTPDASVAQRSTGATGQRNAVTDRTRGPQPTADRKPAAARRSEAASVRAARTSAPAPQPAAASRSEPSATIRTEAPALAGAAAAPIESAAPARFERGYVAYLRCQGLPQREGPFPCPRDLALERHVWQVLSELARCPLAPQQRGPADVRLDFMRSRGHAEWLVASGALDRDTVSRCVGSELSGVATSLRPTRMIVAFRFSLH